MSLARLKKLKKNTEDLILSFDRDDILGPIPFLEEACENFESAIEEFVDGYGSSGEDDED